MTQFTQYHHNCTKQHSNKYAIELLNFLNMQIQHIRWKRKEGVGRVPEGEDWEDTEGGEDG